MRLGKVLASEVASSKGDFSIEPVPPEKQPSGKTLKRIKREIDAQLKANEIVAFKSMHNN